MAPEHYSLHVPKGTGNQTLAALNMVPANHCDTWRMHPVAPGENLAAIAKRYSVSPASIVTANNLKSADAPEGDRLMIPLAARALPLTPVRSAVANSGTARRTTPGATAHTTHPASASHTASTGHPATHAASAPHNAPGTHAAAGKAPAKKNTAPARTPQKSSVLVARATN